MARDVTNYAGLAREGQEAAIRLASTREELDSMWSTWEGLGYSREGRLFALVTLRRAELAERTLKAPERALLERVGLADMIPSGEEE